MSTSVKENALVRAHERIEVQGEKLWDQSVAKGLPFTTSSDNKPYLLAALRLQETVKQIWPSLETLPSSYQCEVESPKVREMVGAYQQCFLRAPKPYQAHLASSIATSMNRMAKAKVHQSSKIIYGWRERILPLFERLATGELEGVQLYLLLQDIKVVMMECAEESQRPPLWEQTAEGQDPFKDLTIALQRDLALVDPTDLSGRYTVIAQSAFAQHLCENRRDSDTEGLAEALYRSCQPRTLPEASPEFADLMTRLMEMTATVEERQGYARDALICPPEVTDKVKDDRLKLGNRLMKEMKFSPEDTQALAVELKKVAKGLAVQFCGELKARKIFPLP